MAGIRSEIVPIALAQGWVLLDRAPGRKGNARFGEFEFERVGRGRVQFMGIDFLYGEKPDVWASGVTTAGSDGACTERCNFHCVADVRWGTKASYLDLIRSLVVREPRRSLPEALARGVECLEIVERFLEVGERHPTLLIIVPRPPYEWPEGYADRVN